MGHFISDETERGGGRLLFLKLVSWVTDLVDLTLKVFLKRTCWMNSLFSFSKLKLQYSLSAFYILVYY